MWQDIFTAIDAAPGDVFWPCMIAILCATWMLMDRLAEWHEKRRARESRRARLGEPASSYPRALRGESRRPLRERIADDVEVRVRTTRPSLYTPVESRSAYARGEHSGGNEAA